MTEANKYSQPLGLASTAKLGLAPERAGLRGFGVTITPGGARNWYAGADGVKRWLSNDRPCDTKERSDGKPD